MQNLEQILAALRQSTQAEAALPALNNEMAEAKALRGKPIAAVDEKTGYVSPFEALTGMIQQGRAAKQRRELTPQIEQANQQVAASKAGMQEHTLRQAMDKIQTQKDQYGATAQAKVDAAELENTNKMTAVEEGYVRDEDKIINAEEEALKTRNNANEQKQKERDLKWKIAQLKANKKNGRYGNLTPNQLQSGLQKFEKKYSVVESVQTQLNQFKELIRPYAKGGQQEGENIKGIGFLEGSKSTMGDVARWFRGEEAQNINASWQNFVSGTLRAMAGTAQTYSETQNVLRGLSGQELGSEDALIKAQQRVQDALQIDAKRIKATTLKPVLNYYEDAYGGADQAPINIVPETLDFNFDGENEATVESKSGWSIKEKP